MSDTETIERIIAGDGEAARELFFVRMRGALSYVGQFYCEQKQEPEELVGELYEYLSQDDWRKLRQFRFSCPLVSYLALIAARYFQSKRNRRTEPLPDGLGLEGDAGDEFTLQDIRSAVERMPSFDGFLLRRLLLEGYRPQDILREAAAMLDKREDDKQLPGYIYTRYNRARNMLRKRLTFMGYEWSMARYCACLAPCMDESVEEPRPRAVCRTLADWEALAVAQRAVNFFLSA